jgi:hypothetical protein
MKKVIKATLRKESESFKGWLKYEITIKNFENGLIETIPAYGKDLQDALNRVVHDEKVEKIKNTTSKVPTFVWVLMWLGYIMGLYFYVITLPLQYTGLVFILGIMCITFTIGYLSNWLKYRNKFKW